MNMTIWSMSPANAAIAEKLVPDFDARDTGAGEIEKLMDAARMEGAAHWRDMAQRAAGSIDALLLYATVFPDDSHVLDAHKLLGRLRSELEIKGRFRTESVREFAARSGAKNGV